jgi:hypothetical protein
MLFVKYFDCVADAEYPDGNVNSEYFSNEAMLEVESLGPLVSLQQDESASHTETWKLFASVARCTSEADVDRWVKPLV